MSENSSRHNESNPTGSTTINCTKEEKGPIKTICRMLSCITAEPIVICFITSFIMAALTTQNLNLDKACRVNLQLNKSVCDALQIRNSTAYNKTDEADVQKVVALGYVWKFVLQSAFPIIILIFIGSWSDRNRRRKICIIVPMIGESVAVIGLIVCTYFFYQLPMEFNILAESLPVIISGGMNIFLFAIFTYICNNTNEESRTVRVGITHVLFQLGLTVGQALSGLLLHSLGFFGTYAFSITLYSAAILYAIFFLKEERYIAPETKKKVGFMKDFFDVKSVKGTFTVIFKQGHALTKKKIRLILMIAALVVGPLHGEMSVLYLYTRYKFYWNEVDFSLFFACCAITHLLVTMVVLSVFSKMYKVDDALLGCIAALSKIAGSLMYALAPNPTIFYMGIAADALSGILFVSMRSMISKQVSGEELGKMNAVFGIAEAIVPLIYGPIYSATYRATIQIFPGLFYIMSAVLTIPVVIIFIWLYINKSPKVEEKPEDFEKMQKLLVQ